jgi:hypothetical protein
MRLITMVPIAIYMIIGLVSAIMAGKGLLSRRFLPFHEQAAGKSWDDVEPRLQLLILAFMRLTGLGFLVVALLLLIFPPLTFFYPNPPLQLGPPLLALLYCAGLFIVNFRLNQATQAATPWKGSLLSMILLLAGTVLSLL